MTPQELTQLKGMSLQLSQGDLLKAKDIFEWLKEDLVEQEVQQRILRDSVAQTRLNLVDLSAQ